MLLLSFILACCVQSAWAEDPTFSAGRSLTTRMGGTIERIYTDGVRADFGQVRIRADSAVVRSGSDVYVFARSVEFVDGDRSIRADALTYGADSIARFSGRVRVVDGARSIRARRLTHAVRTGALEGTGVILNLPRGLSLRSAVWRHNLQRDEGTLSGGVSATHPDGSDTTRVKARTAAIFSGGDSIRFGGACRLTTRWLEGTCDSLAYAASMSSARLEDDAHVRWVAGTDLVSAAAEVIVLGGSGASEMILIGGARLNVDSTGEGVAYSLTAEQASVHTADSRIHAIDSRGNSQILFEGAKGKTEVASDEVSLVFEDGHLVRLETGSGRVIRTTERVRHEIEGASVVVAFAGELLKSVRVDSEAVFSKGQNESCIHADHLVLSFEDGELISAEATGAVRGEVEDAP